MMAATVMTSLGDNCPIDFSNNNKTGNPAANPAINRGRIT